MFESYNHNIPTFSVGEISRALKKVIEDGFGYVKIRGEVSGFKKAASGHCYFSLKDEDALISAVCFRGVASKMNFQIEDGMEISVFGKVTTYEGRSNYQIIIQRVEIDGIGTLMELIEKRRKKLKEEGLFDEAYKKPLPFWPNNIAVITSKTGAVIKDIIHRVEDRFPTTISLYSASVQGQAAALEISLGVKYFNSLDKSKAPDIIIIARGGGSFEDLLPFNDEDLVREVFKSKIPVISAVGHETDTTLIDYVSDVRAPTPTAAAEIATPILKDLKSIVDNLDLRLNKYVQSSLSNKERTITDISRNLIHPNKILDQYQKRISEIYSQLKFIVVNHFKSKEQSVRVISSSLRNPKQILKIKSEKVDLISNNLNKSFEVKLNVLENKIMLASKLLDSYHYKKVLKRGYALVRKSGKVVSNINELKVEDSINIEMDQGKVDATIK